MLVRSFSTRTPRPRTGTTATPPPRVSDDMKPGAAQRIDQPHAIGSDDLLVLLGDHLVVRREPRVDELDGDRDVVLDHEHVRRLDRELGVGHFARGPSDLEQALLRNDRRYDWSGAYGR